MRYPMALAAATLGLMSGGPELLMVLAMTSRKRDTRTVLGVKDA